MTYASFTEAWRGQAEWYDAAPSVGEHLSGSGAYPLTVIGDKVDLEVLGPNRNYVRFNSVPVMITSIMDYRDRLGIKADLPTVFFPPGA